MSKIEWTGRTLNPVRARFSTLNGDEAVAPRLGWHCEHASEGCRNCYAESMNRWRGTLLPFKPGHRKDVEIFLDEKILLQPLRWRTPQQVFLCSMTDLFADFVPDEMIDKVFAMMALCPQHTFQVLTKRAERMRAYFARYDAAHDHNRADFVADAIARQLGRDGAAGAERTAGHPFAWPLPNVWLGVSVEDQRAADERIPDLLATPAAVRFLSCEPLLGPVDLRNLTHRWPTISASLMIDALAGGAAVHSDLDIEPSPIEQIGAKIDWVICGGESGRNARPMHPAWARSLRDQCAAAGVPFFFKQWGEWAPDDGEGGLDKLDKVIGAPAKTWAMGAWLDLPKLVSERAPNGDYDVHRIGKKLAGRLLDGVEHNGMPA